MSLERDGRPPASGEPTALRAARTVATASFRPSRDGLDPTRRWLDLAPLARAADGALAPVADGRAATAFEAVPLEAVPLEAVPLEAVPFKAVPFEAAPFGAA